ncbi:MAG: RNA polymerase sigma factor [Bacteroidales bacterium]
MGITTDHLSERALHDYHLVKHAVDGDQSAYAELMQRYRDSVYFMFMKKFNNSIEAEDLTIEVFSKAFLKLRSYSPEFAFSTWLNSIASNHYIDFLRKKKKAMLSIDHQEEQQIQAGHFLSKHPDPEENMIQKEQVLMLKQVVEKLKPHYRTLIELRYYRDYSIEEIACELHLPTGTVKAKLFRGREFLFNILKSPKLKI